MSVWTYGRMDVWMHELTDVWLYDMMDVCNYGIVVVRTYGHTYVWYYGRVDVWSYERMTPLVYGIQIQRYAAILTTLTPIHVEGRKKIWYIKHYAVVRGFMMHVYVSTSMCIDVL